MRLFIAAPPSPSLGEISRCLLEILAYTLDLEAYGSMKPHFNLSIWAGFLIVFVSVASYIPIFTMFASTRDVP